MNFNESQLAVIQSTGYQVAVVAGPGCHERGQKIILSSGFIRPVESIEVGDKLAGDTGERTVLSLIRGRGQMVNVIPVKGEPFRVNLGHILTVLISGERYNGELIDVKVSDWINWCEKRKTRSKLVRGQHEFKPQSVSIDPYFLGLILGDGTIGPSIAISKPGDFILKEVENQALKYKLNFRTRLRSKNNPTHYFTCGSAKGKKKQGRNPLINELRAYGLFQRKAATKFVPDAYKHNSSAIRAAVLAGIIDCDGYVGENTVDFISASKQLSEDVCFLSRSLGLAAYIKPSQKRCQNGFIGNYFRVSISGELAILPCRRLRFSKRKQIKSVLRTGFKIENSGIDDFFGFELDGNGRYLLGDFTITHNSGKTATLISSVVQAITDGVAQSGIVVISFTNAAADEITARLQKRIPGVKLDYCGTLHGWVFGLLRQNGSLIGLPQNLTVIDNEMAEETRERVAAELKYRGTKEKLDAACRNIATLFGQPGLVGAELVAAAYHMELFQNGLIDFDAILSFGLLLIRKMSDEGRTFGDLLLVDEFQDSGDTDCAIYLKAGFGRKLFVGDLDQSMYSFRGAKPENFRAIAGRHDFKLMTLQENYRSVPVICNAANNLIAHNVKRIAKMIVPSGDRTGGSVRAFQFADEISQRTRLEMAIQDARSRGKSCAVLCRSNWQVSEFSATLRAGGLPIRAKTTKPLPDDWKMARRAVAFFSEPENDHLCYQMLRFRFGEEDAKTEQRKAKLHMRSLNQQTLNFNSDAISLATIPDHFACLKLSVETVSLVKQCLTELPATATLRDLALLMAEQGVVTTEEGEPDGVDVMTFHGAKGKEWDCVFLPAWVQPLFPAKAKDDTLEELRRMAFVAVTRAREEVWIGCPAQSRPHAKAYKPEPSAPSCFVAELGIEIE